MECKFILYTAQLALICSETTFHNSNLQPLYCNYSALMTPILESEDYILSLEVAPPRITIRQMYSTSSPSSYPLMWVANYYNQSALLDTSYAAGTANSTTTSCSLQFTGDGDLQLLLVSGNTNTTARTAPQNQVLLWNSGTAGMGVQLMNLTTFGNLVLLDAKNNSIWQSFDHPNSQILYSQKFRSGMRAVAASTTQNDFAGGIYSMVLENGDLRLYSNFDNMSSSNSLCYWSLNETKFGGNLTDVAYASTGREDASIVLYAADGSVIYQYISGESAPGFPYMQLDSDGNLRTYSLQQGVYYDTTFTALSTGYEYPNFCGSYGICSSINSTCSCLSSFQPVNASDPSQGCFSLVVQVPDQKSCSSSAAADNSSSSSSSSLSYGFLDMGSSSSVAVGFDYTSNKYSKPLEDLDVEECKSLCLQNCSCVAAFYYSDTGSCFHIPGRVQTIQRTSNPNQLMFLKILVNQTNPTPNPPPSSPGSVVPAQFSSEEVRSTAMKMKIAVAIAAGLFCMLIGIVVCIWRYKSRQKRKSRNQVEEEEKLFNMLPSLPPRFTYKELQSVTQNFKEKLGAGGFGSVYAGTLPDKSQVAVKQLEGGYTGEGKKQFQAEVATIGSINHVNLVRLRGFCMEAQHRLLVYEYMASSSLDRSLFRSDHHDLDDQPTSRPEVLLLDWSTRYSIALGVARGLAYLHEGCSRQIIHCDIKPENILLDEHMTAKLSDFGLSKVLQKDRSNKISNMRGTRGYLAREWLLLNAPITPKSDVYSFGMVLLELCTGRRNLNIADVENLQETEECYVPAKALSLQGNTEKLLELIDAQLGQEFDKQQAVKLIEISLACIQDDPASRPTMGTVVKLLEASITTSSNF
ncbi:unnamed protein product [Sphagnum jensenii]